MGVSLGRYPVVTARLTFDPRKAQAGGSIFIVDRASPADDEAIRLSEAVLFTSGGLLSHGASVARAHRVPALILGRARWAAGPALALDLPVFVGARQGADGFQHRFLQGTKERLVAEGEVVTIDAADGLLRLYPADQREGELALAQAVRAFEGLRDPDSLVHWFESRSDDAEALAVRLEEELSPRVLAATAPPEDFDKALRAIRLELGEAARRGLDAAGRSLAARVDEEEADLIADAAAQAKEAGTETALLRIQSETSGRWERLKSLSSTLGAGLPKISSVAYGAFSRAAKDRLPAVAGKAGDWRAAATAAGSAEVANGRLGSDIYKQFVDEANLQASIDDLSGNASLGLRLKSQRIRELFDNAKLEASSGAGGAVLAAAPAGDYFHVESTEESVRFVPKADLLKAVERAWASYWNAGPLGARLRRGDALSPEVLIETAMPAEVSGVVFSRDPGSLRRERIVAEAVWGEREGFDSGEVSSDMYTLDRRTGREVLPALIADKRRKFAFDAGKGSVTSATVPQGASLTRSLSTGQLAQLARNARALDSHFGGAVQADFTYSGGKLFILSAKLIPGQEDERVEVKPSLLDTPKADVAPVLPLR
jgi:phosphoenolpyruvate synthase/pyruvate phosphate dikinase